MSFVLAVSMSLPVTAFASQSEVTVDNHVANSDAMLVSGLVIDGVDSPALGNVLDDTATVTSKEGESWDVPVLWIADDMQLANQAEDSHAYLPAIAFFVPQSYTLEGSSFQVTLSDSLTKLFGSSEVVSVYDSATGITYILPASLRGFFASAPDAADPQEAVSEPDNGFNVSPDVAPANNGGEPQVSPEPDSSSSASSAATSADDSAEPQFGADLDPASMVEVYCSEKARLAFSDRARERRCSPSLHRSSSRRSRGRLRHTCLRVQCGALRWGRAVCGCVRGRCPRHQSWVR